MEKASKEQIASLDAKVDRLEVKVYRFYWFLVGILGATIGSLAMGVVSLAKYP